MSREINKQISPFMSFGILLLVLLLLLLSRSTTWLLPHATAPRPRGRAVPHTPYKNEHGAATNDEHRNSPNLAPTGGTCAVHRRPTVWRSPDGGVRLQASKTSGRPRGWRTTQYDSTVRRENVTWSRPPASVQDRTGLYRSGGLGCRGGRMRMIVQRQLSEGIERWRGHRGAIRADDKQWALFVPFAYFTVSRTFNNGR